MNMQDEHRKFELGRRAMVAGFLGDHGCIYTFNESCSAKDVPDLSYDATQGCLRGHIERVLGRTVTEARTDHGWLIMVERSVGENCWDALTLFPTDTRAEALVSAIEMVGLVNRQHAGGEEGHQDPGSGDKGG
jgi:hypothetical protein